MRVLRVVWNFGFGLQRLPWVNNLTFPKDNFSIEVYFGDVWNGQEVLTMVIWIEPDRPIELEINWGIGPKRDVKLIDMWVGTDKLNQDKKISLLFYFYKIFKDLFSWTDWTDESME